MTVHGGLRLALDVAILELKLASVEQVLTRFIGLERRYSPDQPRVPAGTPEGGEWTSVGGGRAGASSGRKPIRTALAGVLVMQRVGVGDDRLIRHCIYEDMFGRQRAQELDAAQLCPPTMAFPPYHG